MTDWKPTKRQIDRSARIKEKLLEFEVPLYSGPLYVEDDEEVKLQDPKDVARRAIILWAVILRGEGVDQSEAKGIIDNFGLWDFIIKKEAHFLNDKDPDPDLSASFVWRLESIWVLLWSLGLIESLDWPRGMCDVESLVNIIKPNESNPDFIKNAKLISVTKILDAQELTMKIHWAIRDDYLNNRLIADELDWRNEGGEFPTASPSVAIIEERHHTLNWLTNFLDPDSWDDVDTPT